MRLPSALGFESFAVSSSPLPPGKQLSPRLDIDLKLRTRVSRRPRGPRRRAALWGLFVVARLRQGHRSCVRGRVPQRLTEPLCCKGRLGAVIAWVLPGFRKLGSQWASRSRIWE